MRMDNRLRVRAALRTKDHEIEKGKGSAVWPGYPSYCIHTYVCTYVCTLYAYYGGWAGQPTCPSIAGQNGNPRKRGSSFRVLRPSQVCSSTRAMDLAEQRDLIKPLNSSLRATAEVTIAGPFLYSISRPTVALSDTFSTNKLPLRRL